MSATSAAPSPSFTLPERYEWWRKARFGMFIHWGVFAVPAGVYQGRNIAGASEWLMHSAHVPVAEYKQFAADFNPIAYNPDEWVQMALDAGMSYVVSVTKHHDGFAMFKTAANDWNVVDATPHGKDLLAPLVESCRKAGVPIGFYYSHAQDWINGGATYAGNWDPAQDRDFDEYIDQVAIPQIRELLTNYGPNTPFVLWWDTPASMTPERAKRIDDVVQSLAPGILQNDRLGGDYAGDFDTPEQRIPADRPGRSWETCMTTNESWGFNIGDNDWKSPAMLISQLCEVVSQGGNYLLNIGPKADGSIPEQTVAAFQAVGQWMRVNGESIHSADAGPFPHRLPWGFATQRDNTIYLHVEKWPEDGKLFVPLLDLPEKAYLLANRNGSLAASPTQGGFELSLPGAAPDPAISVIAIAYSFAPRVGDVPPRPRPPIIPQPADGAVTLRAADCEVFGNHISLTAGVDPQIGCWSGLDCYPQWRVRIHRAGAYKVELIYAVPNHRQGTVAEVILGDQKLPFDTAGTGGWGEFVRAEVGITHLEPNEELFVRVMPVSIPVGAVMNLRAVCLTPAGE